MLCERCHKRLATQRYAEVVDGRTTAKSICKTCLDDLQNNACSGFELSGAAPTPNREFFKRFSTDRMARHILCSGCGMDLVDALQNNTLGCSMCYSSFSEHIPSVLRALQPGLAHRGKIPVHESDREQLNVQLQSKRFLLRTALKTENYEEAARLRDEIHEMEGELSSGDAQ